ncbi:hypothetical protein FUAX_24280 [Fulvitalea axinellae]|uniref:Uncharacterized protein n=1 Tax=Fulvitalea axinellae TaxID=1182444 RepID=A0AAU9CCY7_9BACT|nr:hypothetical protein FUAX_24280 [Fulvitalea axinellae]
MRDNLLQELNLRSRCIETTGELTGIQAGFLRFSNIFRGIFAVVFPVLKVSQSFVYEPHVRA